MTYQVVKIEPMPNPALGGRIDFLVVLKNPGKRAVITDARALVTLKASSGDVALGWAQMLWMPNHIEVARHGGECTLTMTLFVDHSALRRVEEARAGQKPRFAMRFVLLGVRIEGELHEAPTPRTEVDGEFTIGASEWVKEFLPAFGFGTYELLELQLPALPTPQALRKEADLIQRAVRNYNMGEYEDVSTDCRKMVESLKGREKELELEALVGREEWKRLKDYLSIALHDDTQIPKKIVRSDAEVALRLAQTVYLRVASALDRPHEKRPVSA